MRILDRLYYRNKLKIFIIVIVIQIFYFQAWSAPNLVVKSYQDLIKMAKIHSVEYNKIKTQFEIDSLNADSLLEMYNWTILGDVLNTNAQAPSTSPFAPSGPSLNTRTSLQLEKQTPLGITPFLSLSTEDVSRVFPSAGAVKYQIASLETGLRINLIKAILGKSSLSVIKHKAIKDELANLAKKTTDRNFSVRVLKSYFKYLKSYKRLEILKTQCNEYIRLHKISLNRFKKKLIREKDYLIIEVLFQNCLLNKETAVNNLNMNKIALLKTSGLPLNTAIILSDTSFSKDSMVLKINLKKNFDYQLAKKALKALRAQTASMKFKFFPKINLNYSLKSQASEDGVGNSLSESLGLSLPTHSLGINLKYEFGKSASKISFKKLDAEKRLQSLQLDQLTKSLEQDEKKISVALTYLAKANKKAKKLVHLQKRKSILFKKDFENGRGGIRNLVEAQINYLNSLERALEFEYSQTLFRIDYYSLSGDSLAKFN